MKFGKTIKKTSPKASGVGLLTQNESCPRKAYAIHKGVPMEHVAKLHGYDIEPAAANAVIKGNAFEKHLLENQGSELRALLVQEGVLGAHEQRFVNIKTLVPNGTMQERAQCTESFLHEKRNKKKSKNTITGAVLSTIIGTEKWYFEADALIAKDNEPFYRVFEFKMYPDRDYSSDHEKIAAARRQIAVYHLGLQQYLKQHSTILPINFNAGLILTKPTTYKKPIFRETSIQEEFDQLSSSLCATQGIVGQVEQYFSPNDSLDDPKVWSSIPYNYVPNKCSICPMMKMCRKQAMTSKSPNLLSPALRQTQGLVRDTDELWALTTQQQAPATQEQLELQNHLHPLYQQYIQVR